jgi:hypothetical protein
MNIIEQLKKLGDFLTSRGITEVDQLEQALTIGSVWDKAYKALYQIEGIDYPYIMEIMQSETENYIVYTDNGNLFKTPYSVTQDDEVELGEPVKVKMDFVEIPQTIQVFRTETGDYQFIAISACSVINRVGEIDSNELFDNFVERFDKDNKPYVTFYHLGEEFKFGHVDQIFHYENFLVSMGVLYQDNIFTKAAIEKFPTGEWGVSPAFWVYKSDVEQIGDIKVPVYTDGEMFELSVCQENHAANYFTQIKGYQSRTMQMSANEREKYEQYIKDFVGDKNADEALKILDDVEERQQVIDKEQMIFRTQEDTELETELEQEIEIDDEVISQIAEIVNQSAEEKFKKVFELLETMQQTLAGFKEEQEKLQELVTVEVEQIKQEDDIKIQEKLDDLPKAKLKVGYRTRTPENETDSTGVELTEEGYVLDARAIRSRANKLVGARK